MSNLKHICNSSKLIKKSSIYKGVDFVKRKELYRARVTNNGKVYHIGYFTNEVEASKAYDAYVIENYIQNRSLNHISSIGIAIIAKIIRKFKKVAPL